MSELPFLSPPPLFDVRTAEEYTQGHIPGALNQPLFDHFERSTIGTLYKQVSPESAMAAGLHYVEPRVQQLVESFQPWQKQPLIVYCARGGMRSASVSAKLFFFLGVALARSIKLIFDEGVNTGAVGLKLFFLVQV